VGETPAYEGVDTRRFPASWRLTFRYDEDGVVELADRQRVPMVAPGSPGPVRTGGTYSGSWVELQDREGRVLFDRVLHDPFRRQVEGYDPPGRRARVTPAPRRAGQFAVILPAIPEAATVVVWSSPLEDERRTEAAREVGRFDLGGAAPGEVDR
jgi:hypothetical protein